MDNGSLCVARRAEDETASLQSRFSRLFFEFIRGALAHELPPDPDLQRQQRDFNNFFTENCPQDPHWSVVMTFPESRRRGPNTIYRGDNQRFGIIIRRYTFP